jgi:rubrerythrin
MICGEVYLENEKPSSCPFCGAHKRFLVLGKNWKDTNDVELTDISKKNLVLTLDLEISNSKFYKCVSKKTKGMELQGIFKGLSKVEAEHADTVSKILKVPKPRLGESLVCSDSDMENIVETYKRENRAVTLYKKFLREATEPRVKQLFKALIEIENDHLSLSKQKMREG